MSLSSSEIGFKPSRVVLLGASGFIGAAIARELTMQAIPTLCLGSSDMDLVSENAAQTLSALLQTSDTVVMLSALTPDKGRDTTTLLKNLAMMHNVCTAIQSVGCEYLVYFSSDAVYGTSVSRVTEETPASPNDLYGAMHLARELMARSLGTTAVLVLRPTSVYGEQDTHNAYGPNRFLRAAQAGAAIILFGEGEETRDHIAVEDVAALTVRCVREKRCGTLNIATGISITFRAVAGHVQAQSDKPVDISATLRANPITHRHYDVTQLIKAFPDFRFVALADGLARSHRDAQR